MGVRREATSGDETGGNVPKSRLVARPRLPPGPLRDFKWYLYRLYLEAGAPTLEQIAALVAADEDLPGKPGKDTVKRLLSGGEEPPGLLDAVSVADVLARAGAGGDPAGVVVHVRRLWTDAKASPSTKPATARQLGALRLGVHAAVGAEEGEEGSLTPYIKRRHDQALRSRLSHTVRDKRSVLAVMVGQSCTGKTRAAYEAVCAVLPKWPVLAPSGPKELIDWIATDSVDAGTVLWLDETQRYLMGPLGEEAALALSTLLDHVAPLAVLGSMWPEFARKLGSRRAGSDEIHFHARALLERNRAELHVPDDLGTELRVLRQFAAHDPRMAAALQAALSRPGRLRVFQQLADGPRLALQYRRGPGNAFSEIEHAVLTAAIDARRLGHAGVLPSALLAEATVGYLPTTARVTHDSAWFATAAESLVQQGALIPDRVAPGLGAPEGYHPADYLDQSVRRTRAHLAPPSSLWEAAQRHARAAEDLCALGGAAQDRRRYAHAVRLYRRAIGMGSTAACSGLAELLEEAGDRTGAEQAAGASPQAWIQLATTREEWGDPDGAQRAYRHAANQGEERAWAALTRLLYPVDRAAAEATAVRAAEAGHSRGWLTLARMHEQLRDTEAARRAFQGAADAGDPWGWIGLARLFRQDGLLVDADAAYQAAGGAGAIPAWTELMRLRWEAGDTEGAVQAATAAANAGDGAAWSALAEARLRAGDRDGADAAYEMAATIRSIGALPRLARLRESGGDRAGAELAASRAAAAGDGGAWAVLAQLREVADDHDGANAAAEAAAEAGDTDAWIMLARLRECTGDEKDAEHAACQAAEAGDSAAWSALSRMRERADDRTGSEQAARRAAELGDIDVWTALGSVREEREDLSAAEQAYGLAMRAGDPAVWRPLGRLREKQGDLRGAKEAYRTGVDAGDPEVWTELLRLAKQQRALRQDWIALDDEGSLVAEIPGALDD
ncbi:hypothetical protein [Streptomyces sp. NPDC004533]|uniref:hypothetical protein n=1 Tax=Streptomyces sp. NPDC004533 TaxID=3154278 RepID=UPI0033A16C08